MSDSKKVAVVGDADLIFGLRALGIAVFSPGNSEEARAIMARVEKERFALCFVQQSWMEALEGERKDAGKRISPVVLAFSDYRDLTGAIEKMVKDMAVRATGSDLLVKRKGQDESS